MILIRRTSHGYKLRDHKEVLSRMQCPKACIELAMKGE